MCQKIHVCIWFFVNQIKLKFEFTDDDVDDKCDSDNPEVMFRSSMVHHGYMGLDNFCNRCGRKLDWGDYD